MPWWRPGSSEERWQQTLARVRANCPTPVFWLVGKTQSGKSSIIRYFTGAADAEIGEGFKPCTRTTRRFAFPNDEAPLLTFLDTRGLEEAGYDPTEDLKVCSQQAHAIIATVKLLDQATDGVIGHLKPIRSASGRRPTVLAVTCLHEAYPLAQHPQPYPYNQPESAIPEAVARPLARQRERFAQLHDRLVPLDLTKRDEGFEDPDYGGAFLKQTLVDVLPSAYRHALLGLDTLRDQMREAHLQAAMPHILGYASMAASAAAIPIPWLDLFLLPGIQARMIFSLARVYHQPMTGKHFLELAGTLGLGLMMRQATRELLKVIPYVGSVASATLAGASTYALGRAFCFYYARMRDGLAPSPAELKTLYQEQLQLAEQWWKGSKP